MSDDTENEPHPTATEAADIATLNALQTSLSAIEANGPDDLLMESCNRYLSRLKNLDSNDKNYMRYQKLNASYANLSAPK